MPYAVAATAWDHLIGCADANNRDRTTRSAPSRATYVDKGPEVVP